MEINEDRAQQNEDRHDSPGSGDDCCSSGSGGWKNWKTVIFILVILAAGAVAARSVLTNGAKTSCSGSSAGLCPFKKLCEPSKACVLDEADSNSTSCLLKEKANTPTSCCPKVAAPGCCPKAGVPGSCPKAGSN